MWVKKPGAGLHHLETGTKMYVYENTIQQYLPHVAELKLVTLYEFEDNNSAVSAYRGIEAALRAKGELVNI